MEIEVTPATGPIPTTATNSAANIKSGIVRTIFKRKRKIPDNQGIVRIFLAASKEKAKQ